LLQLHHTGSRMNAVTLPLEIPHAAARKRRAGAVPESALPLAPAADGPVAAPAGTRLDGRIAASVALLRRAVAEYSPVVYSCSLGVEGVLLVDLICTHIPQIQILTLDTGRLPEETYYLLERLERRYGRRVKVLTPDPAEIAALVAKQGINGFFHSLEARKNCCDVRKLAPFRRAIEGNRAWVTGVRRAQSAARAGGLDLAWDEQYSLYKVSPLLDWSDEDVWAYVRSRDVPYNALHDRGFPSIGCAPCTRAIQPGENPRAGRWWWENAGTRECGLQRPVRAVPEGL
jgi:phosphoadenosine phosphosulfate reductase